MGLMGSPAAAMVVIMAAVGWSLMVRGCMGGLDYRDALSKSLLYLEAQRSGRLPYNQRVKWRHHSGLTDGLQQGVDLVGGYYDAGDHVKFGLPMAFTVTMLSWSAVDYAAEIIAAGEYEHAVEAIKWGTDYFIKAHSQPNVLWAQVGDGDTDHYCWQRSEDMTTPRRAYKIDAGNPGSDLAGETAAAMAAASIVFRNSNPNYSRLLLRHARQLLEFAGNHRGNYDSSVEAAKRYYSSVSGYMDELLWASLWLYRATGEPHYLKFAADKARSGDPGWAVTEFSWDLKYAGVQILAAKLSIGEPQNEELNYLVSKYKPMAEHFLCSCLGKNNSSKTFFTPGGLLYVRRWNNMQYVTGAAFLATVYSDFLTAAGGGLACPKTTLGPEHLLSFVSSQVSYILGCNPMGMSYLVGFGERYPTRVHHRGASIVSYKESKGFIGCTHGYDEWYGRGEGNPNALVGALVGGPDSNDEFRDERGNYMQTEACTYNTAPLLGVLAKLHSE